jgi:hypothetical protein
MEYAEHKQMNLESIIPPQNELLYAGISQQLFECLRVSPEVLWE